MLFAIFDKQGKNLTIKYLFKKFMDKVVIFFETFIYLFMDIIDHKDLF